MAICNFVIMQIKKTYWTAPHAHQTTLDYRQGLAMTKVTGISYIIVRGKNFMILSHAVKRCTFFTASSFAGTPLALTKRTGFELPYL